MKVLKFGGTSVGSVERLKALIPLVNGDDNVIVVLSAMSGTTNSLVEICELLKSARKKEASEKAELLRGKYLLVVKELLSDDEFCQTGSELVNSHFNNIREFTLKPLAVKEEKIILAKGELITSALFHLLLLENQLSTALLPALNFMRIDKDGEPDYYYIEENIKRELESVGKAKIIVTQGFICRNVSGAIDNLKRGGSDYSATIIGSAINAESVEIWTDISGFRNNDPRFVENTSVIRKLSYDEAAELAYFGAKILHPSSVYPARIKNIPVWLKNTLDPADQGTLITDSFNGGGFRAVAAKDDITSIKVKSDRMLLAYGFLRKIFEIFEAYRTPIDMITTSEVAVSLTIDDTSYLDGIVKELHYLGQVEIIHNQTIICVVGDFIGDKPGIASKVFNALESTPVSMISYGGSSHNISLLIDTKHKREALNLLSKNLLTNGDVQ